MATLNGNRAWQDTRSPRTRFYFQNQSVPRPTATATHVTHARRFESCWPAIIKGVDGVLLVYNPEIPIHDTEVGIW